MKEKIYFCILLTKWRVYAIQHLKLKVNYFYFREIINKNIEKKQNIQIKNIENI